MSRDASGMEQGKLIPLYTTANVGSTCIQHRAGGGGCRRFSGCVHEQASARCLQQGGMLVVRVAQAVPVDGGVTADACTGDLSVLSVAASDPEG